MGTFKEWLMTEAFQISRRDFYEITRWMLSLKMNYGTNARPAEGLRRLQPLRACPHRLPEPPPEDRGDQAETGHRRTHPLGIRQVHDRRHDIRERIIRQRAVRTCERIDRRGSPGVGDELPLGEHPDRKHEKCWGKVERYDEQHTESQAVYYYTCQGHKAVDNGGEYVPKQ